MFYATSTPERPADTSTCTRCGITPERSYDVTEGDWAGARFCPDCASVCGVKVHAYETRTHCKAGHDLHEHGVVVADCGRTRCKACWREQYARRKLAATKTTRTHCKYGHDLTDPNNTYIDPSGKTHCRPCSTKRAREGARRRYHERKTRQATP